jgi:RNA polymerase sigma-70 factor (ECF subfamily)
MENDYDLQLIEEWKSGNEKAFERIFKKYYKSLCYIAIHNTGKFEEAEDLVQELFIEIYNNRGKLTIRSNFRNYIFGALYYKCNHLNRKKGRTIPLELKHNDHVDHSCIPSEMLEEYELEKAIYETIDALPGKCREIFELSRFEKLKHREIADKLSISVKTVETQIGIALKRLAAVILRYNNLIIISLLTLGQIIF